MSENLPDIDDLFRKALNDHEDSPSREVWANIDKHLDKKKVVSISQKYKKLKWVAAALLIFSAGMAMYSVGVRMKNKELVRQNEIARKRVLKQETGQENKNQSNHSGSATVPLTAHDTLDQASRSAPPAVVEDLAAERPAPGSEVKTIPGDEANERRVVVKKSSEERLEKNTSASNKKPVKASKEPKAPYKENETAEIDKPLVLNADEEVAGDDVLTFEKLKKAVDATTATDKEVREQPAMPVLPETNSIVEANNANNRETNVAALSKSVIKPFKGSRFSASIFYSKDFVSPTVDNDRPNFREDDRNEIKNKERISSASSKGVFVNYNFSKNWSVRSGLMFSTITTDIQTKNIFARPDNRGDIHFRINCSAGYSYVTLKTGNTPLAGDSIRALSGKNTLHYFAVPLALSYNIPIGRFSLQPAAGLTANFLTKGDIETVVETPAGAERHPRERIEGLNSSYVNGAVSLATNYYFTKNLALNFTPIARFALSAINKDAPVKTYINSFGLAAGLTIAF